MENIEMEPKESIQNSNGELKTEPVIAAKTAAVKKAPTTRTATQPKPATTRTRVLSVKTTPPTSRTSVSSTKVPATNPTSIAKTRVIKDKIVPVGVEPAKIKPEAKEISNASTYKIPGFKMQKNAIEKLKKTKMEIKKKE